MIGKLHMGAAWIFKKKDNTSDVNGNKKREKEIGGNLLSYLTFIKKRLRIS